MDFVENVIMDKESIRVTSDGYLTGMVPVARTGIQQYLGREVDPSGQYFAADQIVSVYRPEEEVFHKDAVHSIAHRPVTMGHPSEKVTSENWKDFAVGNTGDEVVRDGQRIRVPMVLMDKSAIDEVRDGTKQLSLGYLADIAIEQGATPDGEKYDAVQRNIRVNHLAVVRRARGGEKLSIGDQHEKDGPMNDKVIQTAPLLVDGLTVQMSSQQDAQIVQKHLDAQNNLLVDAGKALETAKATISDHEKTIADNEAKIKDLESKILGDADLDALIADRASLMSDALKVCPDIDLKGKTPAEIRAAVVADKSPDMKLDGKSDDYVAAVFDGLVANHQPDTGDGMDVIVDSIAKSRNKDDSPEAAHAAMVADMMSGNMGKSAA